MIAVLPPPPPATPTAPAVDVAVARAPSGGWQITATLAGRVLATRLCDDWHRVERLRDRFVRQAWASPEPGR